MGKVLAGIGAGDVSRGRTGGRSVAGAGAEGRGWGGGSAGRDITMRPGAEVWGAGAGSSTLEDGAGVGTWAIQWQR